MTEKTDTAEMFTTAMRAALDYRQSLSERPHRPTNSYRSMRDRLRAPVPETGAPGQAVISTLISEADPGLMSMAGPRFFGWVLGASDPVGVAADWLVSAWSQNTGVHEATPATAAIEEVAAGWLLELLDLPRDCSVGFATGASVGNFIGLTAARGALHRRAGWDSDADGLFGAPPISVFIGDDAHTSVFSALQYCGLGRNRVTRIATDDAGAMQAADLHRILKASAAGPRLIIAQAGQINTGAFDPLAEIGALARTYDAWMHVDGAFGLWARANPETRALAAGAELADSLVTDGHKWLQVPFDCGYVFVRDEAAHRSAMTTAASYLPVSEDDDRVPSSYVPELSRRARGVPTWAIIKSLGRDGIAAMVARHCRIARAMASGLAALPGVRVHNNVVLNQFVVSFGDDGANQAERDAATRAVIAAVQDEGDCYLAGARWRGAWVMRISVISGATTDADGERAIACIARAWAEVRHSV